MVTNTSDTMKPVTEEPGTSTDKNDVGADGAAGGVTDGDINAIRTHASKLIRKAKKLTADKSPTPGKGRDKGYYWDKISRPTEDHDSPHGRNSNDNARRVSIGSNFSDEDTGRSGFRKSISKMASLRHILGDVDLDEENDPNMGTLYEGNLAPADRDTSPPPPFKDWNQGSGNFVRRTSKSFRTSLSKVMGAGRLSDIDLEDGQTDKMLDRMDQEDMEGDALFTISRSGDVGVCGRRRCGLISCLGCLIVAAVLVILFTDNNLGVLHGKFPGQKSPSSAPVGDDDIVINPPEIDDDDDDFVPPRPPTIVDDDDDDFVVPGQPPVINDDDDDFVVPGQPPVINDDDDDFVVPGQPPVINDDDDDFVVPPPPVLDDDDFVVPGQPPIIDDDDDFVPPVPPIVQDDDDFVVPGQPPIVQDDDDFVVPGQPPIIDDDDDFVVPGQPPIVQDDDDFVIPVPPVVQDDDDFVIPTPPIVQDDDDFVFVPPLVNDGLPQPATQAPVQGGTTGGGQADWQIEDTEARVWGYSSRVDLNTGASVEGNKPHEDTIFLVNRSGFFSEDVTFQFDNLDSIEFNRIYIYDGTKNEIAFEHTWYNDEMTEQYTSGTIFETTMDVAVLHELIKEEIHSRHPNHNVSFV